MPAHRCREQGCGRFVSAAGDICARHATTSPERPSLDPEIEAMRELLTEVQKSVTNTEAKAKLIPRIVSVSIQAIKAGRQIGSEETSDLMRLLAAVESELEARK